MRRKYTKLKIIVVALRFFFTLFLFADLLNAQELTQTEYKLRVNDLIELNRKEKSLKSLCKENETPIVSCKLENKKYMSFCLSTNEKNPYLQFRYGRIKKIKLVYPESLNDSFRKFHFSFFHRGGGEQNAGLDDISVKFEYHGFKIIYHLYLADLPDWPFFDGLIFSEKTKEKSLKCKSNKIGYAGTFEDFLENYYHRE